MAQVKIGDAHGLYRVLVGLTNATGYSHGVSPGTPTPATLLNPYIMKYAQSAEIAMPDRTTVDFTGGDVWTGSFVYGITSLGTFQLTSSTVEADLIALLSSSVADNTSNTSMLTFSDNIMLASPPQAWMMIIYRLQSKEAGSVGANKYMQTLIPRAWIAPKGVAGAPAFQTAGTYGFTITPTIGDRFPWGLLFSGTTMALADNVAPTVYLITDNPLHTTNFISDGGATEAITLPYRVASAAITTPDSGVDRIQFFDNGIRIDANSVNVTSGACVVAPDGGGNWTAGDYIGIVYETNYVTTS